jgi:hypothetical protein
MRLAKLRDLREGMADAHLAAHVFRAHLALSDEFPQALRPLAHDLRWLQREGFFQLVDEEAIHHMQGGDGGPILRGTHDGLFEGHTASGGEIDGGDEVVKLFHDWRRVVHSQSRTLSKDRAAQIASF